MGGRRLLRARSAPALKRSAYELMLRKHTERREENIQKTSIHEKSAVRRRDALVDGKTKTLFKGDEREKKSPSIKQ